MSYLVAPSVSLAEDNCVTDDYRSPPWLSDDSGFRPRQPDEGVYRDGRRFADNDGFRPRPGDEAWNWRTGPESECRPRQYDASKYRGYRPPRDAFRSSRPSDGGRYNEHIARSKRDSWIDRGRSGQRPSSGRSYTPGTSWPDHVGGYPGYTPPAYPGHYGFPDYNRYSEDYSSDTGFWPFSTNMWDMMPMW